MTYEDTLEKLKLLQNSSVMPSDIVTQDGKGIGIFHGYAIDSETLEIFAISEMVSSGNWRTKFLASPADNLEAVGSCSKVDIMDNAPDLQSVQHRKGGFYTQVRDVHRGDEVLVLYISDKDRIWWIRPKDMFEDGRFSPVSIPK